MPDPVSPWDGGPMAGTSPRAAHNGENTVIVVIRVIAIAVTNSRAPGPCRAFHAGHFRSHKNSTQVRTVLSVLRKRR